MKSSAPQIGFDRFIQLDWAAAALSIRAGISGLDDLNALLVGAGLSLEARKKTRTVLNRLWLEPRASLVEFVDRGVSLYTSQADVPTSALCWGGVDRDLSVLRKSGRTGRPLVRPTR
jgi:hypothetical protein